LSAATDRTCLAALAAALGPVFRGLWLAWLAANLTMWMNDVAAAWLMTSLTTSPVMVALVQTASTLPVFLLGLPSGALADIVDRRRYFAATQLWVRQSRWCWRRCRWPGAHAPLLLLLTFANGIGLAMRWPVFAAIVPQVVPRAQLPQALALNGIAMNLSRVVGPVLAGALLARHQPGGGVRAQRAAGGVAFVLILRWRASRASQRAARRALRRRHARRLELRHAVAAAEGGAAAHLPVLPAGHRAGGAAAAGGARPARRRAGTFTVMLSCMGVGAIVAALYFPRWRARYTATSSCASARWCTRRCRR
jgi:MFS family permease